jgi:hypothetical protein
MRNGPLEVEVLDDPNQPLECATCGRALDGDPEGDPKGENGQPLCGGCNRARNFDVELEELSQNDDNLW